MAAGQEAQAGGRRAGAASDRPGRRFGLPGRRGLTIGLILRAGAGLVVAARACGSRDGARRAADRFVDRYYVEIDLPRARELTTGLARAKIDQELELLQGIEAAESGARPSVHYRFLERRKGDASGERTSMVYELSIHFEGGDEVVRRALVTVGRAAGSEEWQTENFSEFDG